MADLFDQTVLCSECGKKMEKIVLVKNGFKIRALKCEKCQKIIHHPGDIEEYKKYVQLRQKPFAVKLRMVGNSYTVSIPREIIDFHREQEHVHQQMDQRFNKMRDEMIKMFLEDVGRISLCFPCNEEQNRQGDIEKQDKVKIIKKIRIRNDEEDD